MTNVKGAKSDAPCKRIDRITGGRLVVVIGKVLVQTFIVA
jgi:hypothetical protein